MKKNKVIIGVILIICAVFVRLLCLREVPEGTEIIKQGCVEHVDSNQDTVCDSCGGMIPFSDYVNVQSIEVNTNDDAKMTIKGNMPENTTAVATAIEKDDALLLAQKYMSDLKSGDVFGGYDISMVANGKTYQPKEHGEKVRINISNLEIDIPNNLGLLHIIDDEKYEILPLSKIEDDVIEFSAASFSKYILITVDSHSVAFSGDNGFTVKDSNGIEIINNLVITSGTNFYFSVIPDENYQIADILLTDTAGNNNNSLMTVTDLASGKGCSISNVTKDLIVHISMDIVLAREIVMSQDITTWTSGEVAVTIEWPNVTGLTRQIKVDDGEWMDYPDSTYSANDNMTIYARLTDGEESSNEVSLTVTNIDKIAPVISSITLSPSGWTTGSVAAYLNASDNGSGISSYSIATYTGYLDRVGYIRPITPTLNITNMLLQSSTALYAYYVQVVDQAGNKARSLFTRDKIDQTAPFISDGVTHTPQEYYAHLESGEILFSNPTFESGDNSVRPESSFDRNYMSVYNNTGNGLVTVKRVKVTDEGITQYAGSDSPYVMKIQTKGVASPGNGGFYQGTTSKPNGVYLHKFIAKVPVGYTVSNHNNSVPGTYTWLTSKDGTGEWKEYSYIWICRASGNFSSFGHIVLNGPEPTADDPLVWYVAYATMFELSHAYDDIQIDYGTGLAATLTIQANDYQSGIKSISVNGTNQTLTGTNESKTAVYNATTPGTYTIVATDNTNRTRTMTREAYQITYDGNGASGGSVTNQIKIKGKSITIRNNGYTNSTGTPFKGWATSPGGSVVYLPGAIYNTDASVTLYAVWADTISWDISKIPGTDNVTAYLVTDASNPGMYKLRIQGTGAIKDFLSTSFDDQPWIDYRNNISQLIIDEGITVIGHRAFGYFSEITNITLPSTLTSIGTFAFYRNSKMIGTIIIPASVSYIGANPFIGTNISNILVESENTAYNAIDGVLYTIDGKKLITYPIGKTGSSYTVMPGTENIYYYSFYNTKLTSIILPSSLKTITESAFNSSSLTTISIPASVTTIGQSAFRNSVNLQTVYLHPKTLTFVVNQNSLKSYAFYNLSEGSIIYTTSKTDIANKFIDGDTYQSTKTSLYYPPKAGYVVNQKTGFGMTATFSLSVTNGNPAGISSYQWQYRTNRYGVWQNATSAQGIGWNTSTFKTVPGTADMQGYQYRCIIASSAYKDIEILQSELENQLISNVATLTLIEANYSAGDVYYTTLEEAYTRLKETNSTSARTITVHKSNVDASTFSVPKDWIVTLNVNGKIITKTTTPITVATGGGLIITGGTITTIPDSTNTLTDTIVNKGELTINNASITNTGSTTGNWSAISNQTSTSKLNLNSGTVKATLASGVTSSYKGRAISGIATGNMINVAGGIVMADSANGIGIDSQYVGASEVNITGGQVISTLGIGINCGTVGNATRLNIRNATITGNTAGIQMDTGCTGDIFIEGGGVVGTAKGIYQKGTGDILMTGGSITAAQGIYNESTSEITINGGSINGSSTGLYNAGTGKLTVISGTIHGTDVGIQNNGNGSITMEGGNITAGERSIYNVNNGTVTVIGGNIVAGERGIFNENLGIVTIGKKDGSVNRANPVIQGETYGVYALNGFKFYDGILKGKTDPYRRGTIADTETYCSAYKSMNGDYKTATLEAGWNVSKTSDDEVWAFLRPDEDVSGKYKLMISGIGNMADYADYDTVPWLAYRSLVSKIVIEEGVTGIGYGAFYGFSAVTSVTLPQSLESIGSYAFYNCTSITGNITIPKNVAVIGENPFLNMPINNITVAPENTAYKAISGVLYTIDNSMLITYPKNKTNVNYDVLPGTQIIGAYALCSAQVSNITLPPSLTEIRSRGIGYTNISSISIPESVRKIYSRAFQTSLLLKSVYLHSTTLTLLDVDAFTNIKSDSVIYTVSKTIANMFVANTHYTSSLTNVYYPPEIITQPVDQTLVCPAKAVISIAVQTGNPSAVSYQWQYRVDSSAAWANVTSAQGTGGNTSIFTTVATTPAMAGSEYRCIISNADYPNGSITQTELRTKLISNAATLTVSGGNYSVNGTYYPTLAEAYAGIVGSSATIKVEKAITDDTTFTIAAGKTITLNTNGKVLTKIASGIINNGTLIIEGNGTIQTIENSTNVIANLITNNGTLTVNGATLLHSGITSSDWNTVLGNTTTNVINLISGTIKSELTAGISSSYKANAISTKGGTITVSGGEILQSAVDGFAILKYDTGKLTINMTAGNITNNDANDPAISCTKDGTTQVESDLIITGGTISSSGDGIYLGQYSRNSDIIVNCTMNSKNIAINHKGTGSVTIRGGNLKGVVAGIRVESTVATSIEGGTITATTNAIKYNEGSAGNLTITGGTLTSEADIVSYNATGNITLNGGKIEGGQYGILYDTNASGAINIQSGEITATNTAILNRGTASITVANANLLGAANGISCTVTSRGSVTVSSGTIEGRTGIDYLATTGNITINDGTIIGTEICINNRIARDIMINGGTIRGAVAGIANTLAGNVLVQNATIIADEKGIWNYGAGLIEVINTNITAGERAIYNTGNGTITIRSGNLTAGERALYNTGTGTITLGTAGGEPTSNPTIVGGTYGIHTAGGIDFFDGMLKGKTVAYQGAILDQEYGYAIRNSTETIEGLVYKTATLEIGRYNVNDVFFFTLADAYASITTSTGTIRVHASNTDNSVFTIAAGKTITLDTSDKVITKIGTNIVNNGTLIINGTGTITTVPDSTNTVVTLIANTGRLTINGATIINTGLATSAWYTILGSSSTSVININSGTIKLKLANGVTAIDIGRAIQINGGTLNIAGGTIEQDATMGQAVARVGTGTININISGGNIISNSSNPAVYSYIEDGTVSLTNIRMTDGNIKSSGDGIYVNANSAVVLNVTSGDIIAKGKAINVLNSDSTVSIGTEGGDVSGINPKVQGDTYGVYSESGFNFYDGVLKGKTAAFKEQSVLDMETGYGLYTTVESGYQSVRLETGWNISKTEGVDNVWAFLTGESGNYTLIVRGSGDTKGYSICSDIPWYSYASGIKILAIEDGVTGIGRWLFHSMTGITELNMPSSVKSIGYEAFRSCNSLTEVTIPATVSSIESDPFCECSSLTAINVDDSNPNYADADGILFNKDITLLIDYPMNKSNISYTIPATVTDIGFASFFRQKNLTTIIIPASVTQIGGYALSYSTSLETIYIHSSTLAFNGIPHGRYAFSHIKPGSKIYTVSKEIADNFSGDTYTPANTTICYPPEITTQPANVTAVKTSVATFSLGVQQGVPTATAYKWQYRTSESMPWADVTSAQGTGGTTAIFRTVQATMAMNGYQYRCIISNGEYPNDIIKQEQLEDKLISRTATLTVKDANYQIGAIRYNTLADAFTAATNGATVQVIQDVTDNFVATIASGKNITLDLNGKVLTVDGITTGSLIVNNGGLTINDTSTGGKIESTGTVISGSGTVLVSKGTIKSEKTAIQTTNTITLGYSLDGVSAEIPQIQGEIYAINTTANIKFYDGILKGKTDAYSGTVTVTPTDYAIYRSTENIGGLTYKTAIAAKGWNISATASDNVWAYLVEREEDRTKYDLVVRGTGAMKNFEDYPDVPWVAYRSLIKKLIIEEGITAIGDRAFYMFTEITEINLPLTLKAIGMYAFFRCSNVTGTITIPALVSNIGANPFLEVPISKIIVTNGNNSYKAIDGVLYRKDGSALLIYPYGKLDSSYAILNGVTTINTYAFYMAQASNITLPSTIQTIKNCAFQSSRITNIEMPEGVTQIGATAFDDAQLLETVYIHSKAFTMHLYNNVSRAFTNIKSGSKIYTVSKEVADMFVADNHYTASNTEIYYPPKITTHPTDATVNYSASGIFTVVVREGIPTGHNYQWQYRTSSSGAWTNVTSSQGEGGTTDTFTTVPVTKAMNGYQYRCVIENEPYYPNAQMTQEELASELVSNPATLTTVDRVMPEVSIVNNGTAVITDPTFINGITGIERYDNSATGKVTLSRVVNTSSPTGSGKVMHVKTTGVGVVPGHGGFLFTPSSSKEDLFTVKVMAKIPVGYVLNWGCNATTSADDRGNWMARAKWLTSQTGTGEWETYVLYANLQNGGSAFCFYLTGGTAPTSSNPLEWDVAYLQAYKTRPLEWTNGDMLLIGNAIDLDTGIVAYGFTNTQVEPSTWTSVATTNDEITSTMQAHENGTYYFWAKDASGNIGMTAHCVERIERVKPAITATDIVYENKTTLTITDAESGVIGWQITTSDTPPTSGWNIIDRTNSVTLEDNQIRNVGTYYAWAIDKAGMVSDYARYEITPASITGNIQITGKSEYLQTLTANTDAIWPTACSYTYQWWYSDNANATTGTLIAGATGKTYLVDSSLIGKYVGVTVVASKPNYITREMSEITDDANNTTGIVAKATRTTSANPASLSLVYGEADSTFTFVYTGEDVTATVTTNNANIVTVNGITDGNMGGTVSVKAIGAGTTYVTVTIPESPMYKEAQIEYIVIVSRNSNANITVENPVTGMTYGDAPAEMQYNYTGNGTISVVTGNTGVMTAVVSGNKIIVTPTGAGITTVTINASQTPQYTSEELTMTITVNAKKVNLTWDESSFVYDTEAKRVTATVTNKVGSDNVNVAIYADNEKTNVGDYVATVVALDNDNYTIAGVTNLTWDWEITKADIAPALIMENYIYGGIKPTPRIEGNLGNGLETYYIYTGNDRARKMNWNRVANSTYLASGTYHMYATVGETANYNGGETQEIDFTITVVPISSEIKKNGETYDNTWTNSNLVATITIPEEVSTATNVYYRYGETGAYSLHADTTMNGRIATIVIRETANDVIYFIGVDNEEKAVTSATSGEVIRIDKLKPTIGDISTPSGKENTKIVTVSNIVDYGESGVSKYCINTVASTEGVIWKDLNASEFTFEAFENGHYYVYVKDVTGNISEMTANAQIEITEIVDKVSNIELEDDLEVIVLETITPTLLYSGESHRIEYTVADTNIATVDLLSGLITGRASGETTLTVKLIDYDGTETEVTSNLKVYAREPALIINEPTSFNFVYGDTLSQTTFNYDGNGEITVSSNDENIVTATVTGNTIRVTPINAGSTEVLVKASETLQYREKIVEIPVSVGAKPVVLEWSKTEEHYVYDGNNKEVTARITNLLGDDVATVNVYSENVKINAGDYNARADKIDNPNYTVVGGTNLTYEWSIERATRTIDMQETLTVNYGTNAHLLFTYTGEDALTSIQRGASGVIDVDYLDGVNSGDVTIISVVSGECDVTVNVPMTTNYYGISATCKVISLAISPTMEIANTNFEMVYGDGEVETTYTYGGDGNVIALVSDNNVASARIENDYIFITPKSVGTAKVYLVSMATHTYPESRKEISVVVNPRPVNLTWSNTEYTYDGTEKIVMATVNNIVGIDEVTLSYQENIKTNVGNYTASVSELSNRNYTLVAGMNVTHAWIIKKADRSISGLRNLTLENGTSGEMAFTYTGEDVRANIETTNTEVINTNYIDGNKGGRIEISSKQSGISNIMVTVPTSENYNEIVANFRVEVALEVPKLVIREQNPKFTYGDATKNIPYVYNGDGTITVTSNKPDVVVAVVNDDKITITPRKVGNAVITVNAPATLKYSSASAQINVEITPKPVEIRWGTKIFLYNGETKTVTATVGNVVAGDIVTITSYTGNTEIQKGDYTATVGGLSNTNYTLTGGVNISADWSIRELLPPNVIVRQGENVIPEGEWASGDVIITLETVDTGDINTVYEYSYTGSDWIQYSNPFNYTKESVGTTIYTRAYNLQTGMAASSIGEYAFKLDKTDPMIRLTDVTATNSINSVITKDSTVTINLEVVDDIAGIKDNKFTLDDISVVLIDKGQTISIDNVNRVLTADPANARLERGVYKYTLALSEIESLSGRIVIRIANNGIYDKATRSNTLTTLPTGLIVDNEGPEIGKITTSADQYGKIFDNKVDLEVTARDDNGIKSYEWQVSRNEKTWQRIEFEENETEVSSTTHNTNDDGVYYYRVIVTDIIGNQSISQIESVNVNLTVNRRMTIRFEIEQISGSKVKIIGIVKSTKNIKTLTVNTSEINSKTWSVTKLNNEITTIAEYVVTKNGAYNWQAVDETGNKVTEICNITTIDDVAATVDYKTYNATEYALAKIEFSSDQEIRIAKIIKANGTTVNIVKGTECTGMTFSSVGFGRKVTAQISGAEYERGTTFVFENKSFIETRVMVGESVETKVRYIGTTSTGKSTFETLFGDAFSIEDAELLVEQMASKTKSIGGTVESYYGLPGMAVALKVEEQDQLIAVEYLANATRSRELLRMNEYGDVEKLKATVSSASAEKNSAYMSGNITGVKAYGNILNWGGNIIKNTFRIIIIAR